jgi:hypothetical protein
MILAKVPRHRRSMAHLCCVGRLGESGWGSKGKEGTRMDIVSRVLMFGISAYVGVGIHLSRLLILPLLPPTIFPDILDLVK